MVGSHRPSLLLHCCCISSREWCRCRRYHAFVIRPPRCSTYVEIHATSWRGGELNLYMSWGQPPLLPEPCIFLCHTSGLSRKFPAKFTLALISFSQLKFLVIRSHHKRFVLHLLRSCLRFSVSGLVKRVVVRITRPTQEDEGIKQQWPMTNEKVGNWLEKSQEIVALIQANPW